jgi:hypothetical protein
LAPSFGPLITRKFAGLRTHFNFGMKAVCNEGKIPAEIWKTEPKVAVGCAPNAVSSMKSEEKRMARETLSSAKLKKVLTALEGNWKAEMEGYHTYLAMAERDTDPVRSQVLRHLAGAEWEHAELWHGRIVELGGAEPVYHGKPGGEADSLASRAGGIHGPQAPGDRGKPGNS